MVVLERVAATSEMNGKPSNSIKVMRKFPNPGQAKAKNEIASTSELPIAFYCKLEYKQILGSKLFDICPISTFRDKLGRKS